MKVMFVKPPNRGLYNEICRYIPIGLMYLAAACRERGHEVELFDSLTYLEDNRVLYPHELNPIQIRKISLHPVVKHIIHWGASYERIQKAILDFSPDIVCITAMHSPMYDTAYDVAKLAKDTKPSVVTVIGGSHATIAYEHVLEHTDIDYVLLGEGEQSLPELINCLDRGDLPTNVDGIVFKTNAPGLYNNRTSAGVPYYYRPKQQWIDNLDNHIYPAADLIDFSKYKETSVLITSRGCPYSCAFCTVHPTVGKRYRCRTAENVIKEIEWYINNFNIRKFNIEDDNFTLNIERALLICDLIIQKGIDIELNLPNGVMAAAMTEELADKMLKAGVKFLFFGLETTSSESLSSIQKSHTSLTLVTNALGWFKTRGVTMGASLIIGLPNQTIDDITTDITRLLELNIEFGSPNPFYPIPGSKMYDECIHDGLISPNEDLTWFCEFNFPIQTPNFTRADIYDLWSICNAINYWPQIITAYRDNVPIGERLRYLSQQSAFRGKIEVYPKGIIFIPDAGISYSEINCLSADNDNGALFVDEVTSDMVANMIYFLTRTPHKAVQTKSILNKDPYNEFYIYPYENKRSRAIDNLVSKITRLYNQQQEGHDVR